MFNNLKNSVRQTIYYFWRLLAPYFQDSVYAPVRILVVLLILTIFQILVILKLGGMVQSKIGSFVSAMEARTTLEKQVTHLVSDSKQVKEKPQAAENLLESLPTIKDNYNLLEKLNAAAGNSQVSLLSVSFLPTKNSSIKGLAEQPVEITLQGKFENIFLLLDELEQNRRPISIESVQMIANEKLLSAGTVKADVLIKSYLTNTN